MFGIVYEMFLWLLAILSSPIILYDYFFKGKYRSSLTKRFGFDFPSIKKGDNKVVWLHAVSVGETKAITALVKTIQKELNNPIIIISNITETGHAEAKRAIPFADYHVYLPLDFSLIICPIVKSVKPDLVILSETDYWYNFLKASKNASAKLVLINGKMSIRTFDRLKRFPFYTKSLFSLFDLFCLQSKHYLPRFKELDIDLKKLVVTGNLKFDDEYPRLSNSEILIWKKQFGIDDKNQVIVVGSTHDPEESMIFKSMEKVWSKFPDLKVIIAPRHPERFNEVAFHLEKEKISYVRFTHLDENDVKNAKVILIDAMGVLRKCYQIANLSIVAGSFTEKVGGHNILEPCWYGVPVIYGPYMQTQPELVEIARAYNVGMQTDVNELSNVIIDLLENDDKRREMGEHSLHMLKEINGATKKTWEAIAPLTKNLNIDFDSSPT